MENVSEKVTLESGLSACTEVCQYTKVRKMCCISSKGDKQMHRSIKSITHLGNRKPIHRAGTYVLQLTETVSEILIMKYEEVFHAIVRSLNFIW